MEEDAEVPGQREGFEVEKGEEDGEVAPGCQVREGWEVGGRHWEGLFVILME